MAGWRHVRMAGIWLLLALYLGVGMAHAADVKVRVFLDRDQVSYGDSVTLNVEMSGTTRFAAPDISALKSDFEILGTSHNSNVSIINGQRHAKSIWAVELRPRHVGKVDIPALSVEGHETSPLTLDVTAASTASRGGPGDDVFVEAELDTRTPYVGQQVALTVRLFYTPAVSRGSLDMPQDDAVKLQQLDQGKHYRTRRDGQLYDVLERHYSLIADHAGPINLAPVAFRGVTRAAGGFFGNMQRVSALSDVIRLAVRAKPDGAGKHAWLPARAVSVTLEGVPDDGKLVVGRPLTLTLTETAVGLPFESLPEPQLPSLDGVDVYPDQAQGNTGHEGRWLQSTRTRKFSVVPRKPGTLTLPAITLKWWNVREDKAQQARIKARTLHVVATGGGPVSAPGTGGSAPQTSAKPGAVPVHVPVKSAREKWLVAALWGALALWLMTMAAGTWLWWRTRRRRAGARPGVSKPASQATAKSCRQVFMQAARHGGVTAQCDSLLAWARAERGSVRHLGELAEALAPGPQPQAIGELQKSRYGDGPAPDARTLLAAFEGGFRWRDDEDARQAGASVLPPLYPRQ